MLGKIGITVMCNEFLSDYSIKDNFIIKESADKIIIQKSNHFTSMPIFKIQKELEEKFINLPKFKTFTFQIKPDIFIIKFVPKHKRFMHKSQMEVL